MTSRKSAARGFETEIEKSREEANWKKAVELALQLKARSPQHESLAHFLIGEGKLEAYLEEWPPCKENNERAERELSEARGYLTLATDEAGKKAGVALDAHLLLGKLNFSCGSYDEALKQYKLAELSTLTEKELPVRSLRIVAESYAIKGLCLEQGAAPPAAPPAASRYKQAERDADMIRSFELAADLTLLYLQRAGGAGGSATGATGAGAGAGAGAAGGAARAGPALEAALLRAPLLHVRGQRLHKAIDRYRAMLAAVEAAATQALRLTLARQLAEVLMRGASGQVYKPPCAPAQAPGTLSRRREEYVAEGPWKPKKYAGINQFVPRNEEEEVVLLLLVGEAMAVRGAVLSQSAEFEAARTHSLQTAVALTDLLALHATRWGQLCLVLESLERAMKFSFGSAHVWRQRALATAAAAPPPPRPRLLPAPAPAPAPAPGGAAGGAAGAGVRARGAARRALALAPRDAPLRLVAADTCYHMGWVEEGIELAEGALRIEEEGEGAMLARSCLYTGIGYQMKVQKTNCRIEKDAGNAKCLQLLQRCVQLDDNDHLAFYHLALQYMQLGMLNEAMDATRACLAAQASCGGGLRLCCALWSCACAGPRGARALAAARLARVHYPAAAWPLWALATLQLTWETGEAALATGKELLTLLNSGEAEADAERSGCTDLDALSDSMQDTHSIRDAASVRAEWTSAAAHGRGRAGGGARAAAAGAPPRARLAHARRPLSAVRARVGGGRLRGRGGRAHTFQPSRALHARPGARGRRGVGGGAAVLPERARHTPHAPRQHRAARRGVLPPGLAAAGGEGAARGGGAGPRARRHVAAPGAGAGRAGRAARRRRRRRRRAHAAARRAHAAAAVSPALLFTTAQCQHAPGARCADTRRELAPLIVDRIGGLPSAARGISLVPVLQNAAES